jgi:hypothetical protein
MQCGSCGNFFQFPATDNCPKEHFMYCPKCRCSSEFDYSYTAREYEHENVTNMCYIGEKEDY